MSVNIRFIVIIIFILFVASWFIYQFVEWFIQKKRRKVLSVEYHYLIDDKHYCFTRGQMVIVKEMKKPTALGDILYNTEMEVSQIGEKYITLLNHKETSGLTGGSAEFCFPIEEIGKNIFPKESIENK